MNILYVHGFGSCYDASNPKIVELSKLGKVFGVDLNYCDSQEKNQKIIYDSLIKDDIDLLVGTSMGGYMVHKIANKYSIPYVMINPAINPSETLKKYEGSGVDHKERKYNLTKETISNFKHMQENWGRAPGLLLLDLDDDVIDAKETIKLFLDSKWVDTFSWSSGSHRFDHMSESVPIIEDFISDTMSYGFGNN